MDIKKKKPNTPIDLKKPKKASVSANKKPQPKKSENDVVIENMWNEKTDESRATKENTSEPGKGGIFQSGKQVLLKPLSVVERLRQTSQLLWMVVGVLVIIIVFVVVTNRPDQTSGENTPSDNNHISVSTEPVAHISSNPFNKDQFYGLQTVGKELYFGRIVETNEFLYRVEDVFYESASSTASSTEGRITLVKFGTEEYQPEDELVLPREQVKQIFRLSDDSPILKAINAYIDPGS